MPAFLRQRQVGALGFQTSRLYTVSDQPRLHRETLAQNQPPPPITSRVSGGGVGHWEGGSG